MPRAATPALIQKPSRHPVGLGIGFWDSTGPLAEGKHESCPQCGMSKPAWANLGRGQPEECKNDDTEIAILKYPEVIISDSTELRIVVLLALM